MMKIQQNISLKPYNTFSIDRKARFFVAVQSLEDLNELTPLPEFGLSKMILGGGSNILLTKDFDGIVVKNSIKGIEVINEDDDNVWLKVNAGENWHELVMHCIENGWGGIENLSLIPGQAGAAPMQNIGAYGVELKDVFESLDAWHIERGQIETFNKEECRFGYRESVFKKEKKDKYIILSIVLRLSKKPGINTSYGVIEQVLKERGIENPGIREVSDAVISIRQSKLPDPAKIGNAGSFFKNPEVSKEVFLKVKSQFEDVPSYPIDENTVKIPAGWLIEKAGWKGRTFDNYGVHAHQALVLVNYGGADGNAIKQLAFDIKADIEFKFGIELTPEVNII
jgi:UDP-N-acetylmuramate dehydrogenase